MKSYQIILIIIFSIVIASCEDVIKVDLKTGQQQLCVDAFLTSDPGPKTIKLRLTDNYFNNQHLPPALGADVVITDLIGREFKFTDENKDGDYVWMPNPAIDLIPFAFRLFGNPNLYTLKIKYSGQEYSAVSYLDTVPQIDSLGYEFVEQSIQGPDTIPPGYRLTMFAKDPIGEGNCYWFKTYRNGLMYRKPSQINIAYDAAFGPGSDGINFIPPIVFSLAPERLALNDTITVECLSVGQPTFFYLFRAQTEMNNFGIFATPPANVPTNIINNNEKGPKATGWFWVANLSRKGVRVK